MGIWVGIQHVTEYRYDRMVSMGPQVIRLRPCGHTRTPVHGYSLRVTPEPHFVNWQQDPFGNWAARYVFPERTKVFRIEVDVVAELTVFNPFDFFVEKDAEVYPFVYSGGLKEELAPYLVVREDGERLREFVEGISRDERGTVGFLVDLNQRVQRAVAYEIRLEPGVQACEETLGSGRGSCRDSAYLLVQVLRHLGLAARFVSGYLVQLKADEVPLEGGVGPEKDFTDLHAWAEVYVPGAGWIGMDPTSGLLAGEGHLPLACTPEPGSAAPVSGGLEACETEFFYRNEVVRLREDPRVTKPYRDDEWAAIDAVGEMVDARLAARDVGLTQGGEPTFVSVDDRDGEEWHTGADGLEKRRLALDLVGKLREDGREGALLHAGQGKWYPGESLPRWAYTLIWRRDGVPMWKDPRGLADLRVGGGYGKEVARGFGVWLAEAAGMDPAHLVAGYEDGFYFAWKEGTLPLNLDPHVAGLDDPLERRQLAALLDRGMAEPTGWALPMWWDVESKCWRSAQWVFRRGKMALLPGTSAMGYRLPLDSLWQGATPEEVGHQVMMERSPLEPVEALGVGMSRRADDLRMPIGLAEGVVPRTAMVFEVREGRLHLFFPPVTQADEYLELLDLVQEVAEAMQVAVVVEGYEIPWDRRLERIKVTPDPGVIEVNVAPEASWKGLVERTTSLYRQAREVRLGTEKFLMDGRHTGTGGGNHLTFGGETPERSPFLRKPDLLRSMLTYWQHHPGLSYLFSGMFLGPTSQAPRVDEGRDDRLYELEIAFRHLPKAGDPPWMMDRVLRHLLTDLTGNTHRAEFCIDKLYAPGAASGRLGLLELRSFEMPPHERMSLVQMLLVRGLIAWFWDEPYERKLVRWGTTLHDRFLLPEGCRQDLADVVADLRRAGLPFEEAWLEPFHEFRFPVYGRVGLGPGEIEVRAALEPWHVLGEEAAAGGTARYVDSSVERLQVKVRGWVEGRHVLVCHGRRVPLVGTGRQGEAVAGVRYKAWQPWSAMHPTIGVHSPLVFEWIDTWSDRSLGGCVYHVVHPGGRNYVNFPVNGHEAEARRVSRFEPIGHTPGRVVVAALGEGRTVREGGLRRMVVPPEEPGRDFPMTLDLR